MKKRFIIIASFFFALIAVQVQASSIGVRPGRVELFSYLGQSANQEILLFNTSKEPLIYTLQADTEISGLTIEPSEIRLEADQEQIVVIANKSYFPKKIDSIISIVARSPNSSSLGASAGVKLPLEIIVALSTTQYLLALFLGFAIIIIGKIIFKRKEA